MEILRHTSERFIKTLRKRRKKVHGNINTNKKKWTYCKDTKKEEDIHGNTKTYKEERQ